MTRITLAKSAGFCFGVSRSVDMAEKLLESGPCKCLGPLIHNEEVVASLAARGLEAVSYTHLPVISGEEMLAGAETEGAAYALVKNGESYTTQFELPSFVFRCV